MKGFVEKLIFIQANLNAPKGQYNSFGKYHYRSCEDILQALKPMLSDAGLYLEINDDVVVVGSRVYVKATVTITDGENSRSVTAFAREEETKKGMDGSQVTGAASSYARKYALNGMFGIDDAKDSDHTNQGQNNQHNRAQAQNGYVKQQQRQQQPQQQSVQVDLDAILKSATAAMSCCDMETLKALFNRYQKDLSASRRHLEQLTEIKNIRKQELMEASNG